MLRLWEEMLTESGLIGRTLGQQQLLNMEEERHKVCGSRDARDASGSFNI